MMVSMIKKFGRLRKKRNAPYEGTTCVLPADDKLGSLIERIRLLTATWNIAERLMQRMA
jgi:hypothetical protein